ncbi:hypothetical protein [Enterocloster lavalensis]|uniref:hypothetical protein n=1 Tax=Enterocloster lavalensis TaxID=460384 RepID=UPI002666A213|nr:hypothetical protein [Enterocloster lavalensis]
MMRFLWVEDFNEDKGDRTALEARWKEYFGLEEVIIKEDLKSALEYLDDRENFADFDGVLLDIRFPSGGDGIYEKYFSEIVTKKMYGDYLENGTGILLYLALALRYSYNQERIAFVSGNVDEGKTMRPLTDMVNLLIKFRHEPLSDIDWENYRSQEEILATFYLETVKSRKVPYLEDGTIDWDTASAELWDNLKDQNSAGRILDRLSEVQREIRNDSDGRKEAGSLKYSSVCRQFNECGLVLPRAFEKPYKDRDEKSWSFYEWKQGIETPYYVIRSGLIGMCRILRENFISAQGEEYVSGLTEPFWRRAQLGWWKYLWRKTNEEEADGGPSIEQFIREHRAAWDREMCELLTSVPAMLPAMSASAGEATLNTQAEAAVREILRYVDGMGDLKPEPRTRDLDACCLTMKLARNWTSHQGIRDMTIENCGFLLALCLRGYFDISGLPERSRRDYLAREESLLKLLGPGADLPERSVIIELMDRSFEQLLAKNQAVYKAGDSGKDTPVYKIISGIGHQESKCRETVSMDEIYLLFWQLMFRGMPADQDSGLKTILKYTAEPVRRAAGKLDAEAETWKNGNV